MSCLQASLAAINARHAPAAGGIKPRRQTTDSSASPAKRRSATAGLQVGASSPARPRPASRHPQATAATPMVSPHPSASLMHWSPRQSQPVTADVTNPTGSMPARRAQGLTADLAGSHNPSIVHSSRPAMPKVDREDSVMPHSLKSPKVVHQSPNIPEAEYAQSHPYPRPSQSTSASSNAGLQCSAEAVSRGKGSTASRDALSGGQQAGQHASLQDASYMARSLEAGGVSRSPGQGKGAGGGMVSAHLASPSHESSASKGSKGKKGAGGGVVPAGEWELWQQLQAAGNDFSKGEVT